MQTALLTDTKGLGKSLVLMPGGLTGWISWLPHQEQLAKTYSVTRIQLHAVATGLDGMPLPEDYSLQWEVDALSRTIDVRALKNFDLIAWSYGAAIALSYAIHHPEQIRSLVLIEPPAIWVLSPERKAGLEDDRKAIATLAPGPVTDDQLAWFTHFAGFVPQHVDPRTLPPWPSWSVHKQSLRIGDAAFRHEDELELARSFTKPVLLVKGSGSAEFLHAIIDTLDRIFPNGSTVEFPGGHAPHIISMQPFMETLTAFLSSGASPAP